MTDPFSFDFIKTYLGESAIHQYKKTDFYKGYYDDILKNKRMNQAVCEIVKYQFININRYDEIVEQIDLLSGLDRVAVVIASASPKISNIYLYNGLLWYHTTTKSKRGSYLHSSAEIASFTKESTTFNQPYSNVFMSFVLHNDLNEIAVYIEHNNKLSDDEMAMICTSYALLAEQFTPILGQEL